MGELHLKLGRLPTVDELAAHSGVPKRTTYRYEEALFAGLPYEFLAGLRAQLEARPPAEHNRAAVVQSLLALTRALTATQMQLAQDRATVSAYVPAAAAVRFEGWHAVWRPVLLDDLARRRAATGAEGTAFEDAAVLYRLFAALELALVAWHEAGPEHHPAEFLDRAVTEVFPDLGATG
jgi:hypothetical protein